MIGKTALFAAGAAAGVYATVRVRRLAEAFTPDGIRDRARAVGVGARMMRAEFSHGAAEAEAHLRERYDLAAAQRHDIEHKQLRPTIEERGTE